MRPASPLHRDNMAAAARIKKAVDVPVVVLGGLREIEEMQAIVRDAKADYVALSRPLVRNPNLVARMQSGAATTVRTSEILAEIQRAPRS